MSEATAYSKWYEANREQLSGKRKDRYATDPAYRQRQLDNRAKQLAKTRSAVPLPDAYTTSYSDVAEELGVTIWRMRHWRDKNYFPEPLAHGKFRYFTDHQVGLLDALNEFMSQYPRLPASAQAELDALVNLIHADWNK
jgi:hypothetical protein